MKVGQYYKIYLTEQREILRVMGSTGGQTLTVLKKSEEAVKAAQENITRPPKINTQFTKRINII